MQQRRPRCSAEAQLPGFGAGRRTAYRHAKRCAGYGSVPAHERCLAHLEQRLLAPPPMSVAERAKTVVAEVAELQDDVYSAAATYYRPPTFDEMYLHHHREVMRVPMLLAHIA